MAYSGLDGAEMVAYHKLLRPCKLDICIVWVYFLVEKMSLFHETQVAAMGGVSQI